jgi:histidine triad (HIT) family protein
MYNHAPKNYKCPFCLVVEGIENENVYTKQSDIIYKDKHTAAFISAGWWPNKNKAHVIVVPNKHFENIYDLPLDISNKVHALEKKVSIALKKAYKCDAVSSRQHNEPAGDQDVWHYHINIFPRYKNDKLYLKSYKKLKLSTPKERKSYAEKLRRYLAK